MAVIARRNPPMAKDGPETNDWLDRELDRFEKLRKRLENEALTQQYIPATSSDKVRAEFDALSNRVKSVIDYYDSRAEVSYGWWRWSRVGAILISSIASVLNIVAAVTADSFWKTFLTAMAAVVAVLVGTVTAADATLRWRDQYIGSSELRDAFFRLLTFSTSLWSIAAAEDQDNTSSYIVADAILLYSVERENDLRTRFNEQLRRQMSPSPGGSGGPGASGGGGQS